MQTQSRRPVLIFIALILLAGLMHTADSLAAWVDVETRPSVATSALMFCANLLLYIALILYWGRASAAGSSPRGRGPIC